MLLLTSLLLLAVCSDATPVAHTEVHTDSRRSEEFHAHLARQRRQMPDSCPPGTWYNNTADCASVNYTQFDALGRRASGLLAAPMSQGSCGSCWAFASTGTFTDRRSLAAGQSTPYISPQHMTICAKDTRVVTRGNGCCGVNKLEYGAKWLKYVGATTAECIPYTLKGYSDYLKYRGVRLPMCPSTCSNGLPFNLESIQVGEVLPVQGEENILAAINRGPVMVGMSVTDEFQLMYREGCGVYCSSEEKNFNHIMQ